jgi:pectate lyase
MTMKKILLLVVFVLAAGSLQAQTIIGSTTTAAAIGLNDTTISLTSATGGTTNAGTFVLTVGYEYVIVDASGVEAGIITAINGTTISVTRGVGGTQRKAHATTARIFIGPSNAFYQGPPGSGTGTNAGAACTRAQLQYLPWIDLTSGLIWTCGSQGAPATASTWTAVNPMPITFNSTGWLR